MGTEILIRGEPLEPWARHLDKAWKRELAESVAAHVAGSHGMVQQRASEQRPHKLSFTVPPGDPSGAVPALEAALAVAEVQARVIFSGGVDVDVLPSSASKGRALAFLLERLRDGPGAPEEGVLACGDSGNDLELFEVPGVKACVVSNAHDELLRWCASQPASPDVFLAQQRAAAGILEAARHFNFFRHDGPRPEAVHRRRCLIGLLQAQDDGAGAAVPLEEAREGFRQLLHAPACVFDEGAGGVFDGVEAVVAEFERRYGAAADAPCFEVPFLAKLPEGAAPPPPEERCAAHSWPVEVAERALEEEHWPAGALAAWELSCELDRQVFRPGQSSKRRRFRCQAVLASEGEERYAVAKLSLVEYLH